MMIDPVTGAMAASAITSLFGGIGAGRQEKKAAQAQADAAARAEAMYSQLKLPTVEEQKLLLDRYGYEGDYSPELMEALGLQDSAMGGVKADQAALDAQVQALKGMQEVAEGGLTESDMAAARQLQRQTDSNDIARRKSILNQMAQRGTLGSGMELAAQLQSAQDSTQNQADATDKLIQQAQARALEGLSRTGQLSEQMRYQSFNEGSQKAQARDAINRFNVSNRQDVTNQNVANRNTGQMRNLDARQAVSNANVGIGNTEQMNNKGLLQQDYQNQFNLTNARAGRAVDSGNAQAGINAANANMIGSIAGGLSNAAGSLAGYYADQSTPSSKAAKIGSRI